MRQIWRERDRETETDKQRETEREGGIDRACVGGTQQERQVVNTSAVIKPPQGIFSRLSGLAEREQQPATDLALIAHSLAQVPFRLSTK